MIKIYSGIFFTALATLMYEILLTRIFSVTMGYHFAFMAVSVAMFGMTAGALLVFLFPSRFNNSGLGRFSFLFSFTIILSFLFHLYVPFIHSISAAGIFIVALTYIVVSIPFIFSGICICLVLSSYTDFVGKVYAADLAGAALGCILLIFTLNISGGPASVFVTAILASLGSLSFILYNEVKLRKILSIYLPLLGVLTALQIYLVIQQKPLFKLIWVRGAAEETSVYEKWNSFSRVNISGDTSAYVPPFGWGMSGTFDTTKRVKQLMLNIDANSTTVLTGFDGNLETIEHLKYDIANAVHYLRRPADVLIIGTGGGRDVLSSILFEQKSVVGVEINQDMIAAVNGHFGNFTGHLDRYLGVKFVADEARSYVTASEQKFDIIQLSVIDNWSATSSGAFVLTENALYTREAWKVFLQHLKPGGILTVTRYYRNKPDEIYRLAALSATSLGDMGIEQPGRNIIVLKNTPSIVNALHYGTGTILVSVAPFSKTDIDTVKSLCGRLKFGIIYSPDSSKDSVFSFIASGKNLNSFFKTFPIELSPPSDDSPFFFHMLRFRDVLNKKLWTEWDLEFNVRAIFILFSVLLVVGILSSLCIIIPRKMKSVSGNGRYFGLLVYFAAIGLGFMLIEISQIQRLNIFLGHPTYSLSVSLFSLLLSTGMGSYFTAGFLAKTAKKSKPAVPHGRQAKGLLWLLIVLLLFGLLTPIVLDLFRASDTGVRISAAAVLLFSIGIFMGTAFPMGVRAASAESGRLIPWLWGINGAASVIGSVLAVVIAMAFGIKAAFWTGAGCYVIAFAILRVRGVRRV